VFLFNGTRILKMWEIRAMDGSDFQQKTSDFRKIFSKIIFFDEKNKVEKIFE